MWLIKILKRMRLTFFDIIIKILKINVSFDSYLCFIIQIKSRIDLNYYSTFFSTASTCHASAALTSYTIKLVYTVHASDMKNLTTWHVMSCEWWRCRPIIWPPPFTTHYVTNCGIFLDMAKRVRIFWPNP